jgi:nucleotide-binding universal stress UspA family protein
MLYFAYDGSIHGDWVAHYAIRLAGRLPQPGLRLLHVEDARLSPGSLKQRLERIAAECRMLSVPLEVGIHPERKSVSATLQALVPSGSEHYLVCGTRMRHRGRGFLAGTVSEQLLRNRPCQVLAMRVVQPGLLGRPRNFLVPVAGHPEGIQRSLPFLRLLLPGADQVEILLVKQVGRRRFRHIRHGQAEQLIETGRDYVQGVEETLRRELTVPPDRLDLAVVVSDDVPKEIVILANKMKSQLIFMGASERALGQRLVYGSPIEQVLRNAPCDVAVHGCPS